MLQLTDISNVIHANFKLFPDKTNSSLIGISVLFKHQSTYLFIYFIQFEVFLFFISAIDFEEISYFLSKKF